MPFFDTLTWFGPVTKEMKESKNTWVFKANAALNNIDSTQSGGSDSIAKVLPKPNWACFSKRKACDWVTATYNGKKYVMRLRIDSLYGTGSPRADGSLRYGGTNANGDDVRNSIYIKNVKIGTKWYYTIWEMKLGGVPGGAVTLYLLDVDGKATWVNAGLTGINDAIAAGADPLLTSVTCGLCSKLDPAKCKTDTNAKKYCSGLPTLDGIKCLARGHANSCTDEEPFEINLCNTPAMRRRSTAAWRRRCALPTARRTATKK